jgi:hypothetical protein
MVRVGEDDDAFFLGPGTNRVRAVQLLLIGLMGLLLGWLGNFFVGTSCHFVSVPVQAGQNGENFRLHFGLWKYSPADSALSGYSYCYPYSGSHDDEVPTVSRIANIVALVAGTYSLMVLWWYLVTGRAHGVAWGVAVFSALTAAAAQMATLYFFFDTLCQSRECQWGPGSILAIATAVAWVILAFELYYQAPHTTKAGGGKVDPLENLEMADLQAASQDYGDRFRSSKSDMEAYEPPDTL